MTEYQHIAKRKLRADTGNIKAVIRICSRGVFSPPKLGLMTENVEVAGPGRKSTRLCRDNDNVVLEPRNTFSLLFFAGFEAVDTKLTINPARKLTRLRRDNNMRNDNSI